MTYLGLELDSGDIYLGNQFERSRLFHGPLLPAKLFSGRNEQLDGPDASNPSLCKLAFLELGFDSITNLRRGYLWQNHGNQPQSWYFNGVAGKATSLITFSRAALRSVVPNELSDVVLITFGNNKNYTIGELIHVEQQVDKADLITIQMRRQFSLLPKLNQILQAQLDPEQYRDLNAALHDVIDGYRTSPPHSVIDRCRDALVVILQIKTGNARDDLAALIKKHEHVADKNETVRTMVGDLAHAVGRLHARAKASEKHRNLPAISEKEAELSLTAVGVVLVALEWATWL